MKIDELEFDINKIEKITWKEMMAEWDKKHPVAHWVDETLFHGKSLFHYAPHHTLTHPWILIQDMYYWIEQAYWRVTKGWDYTATWSIDYYLAGQIPQLVRYLKNQKHKGISFDYLDDNAKGHGFDATEKEWDKASKNFDDTLELIAQGFDAYITIDKEMLWNDPKNKTRTKRYKEMKSKFDKGMELFVKYFHTLGD